MNELSLSGIDAIWNDMLLLLSTRGVDFGIRILTAIAIFYIGRLIVGLFTRGLRKLLQKQ